MAQVQLEHVLAAHQVQFDKLVVDHNGTTQYGETGSA